jgi:hypothetical protein
MAQPRARTKARSVVIEDDDWDWLGTWSGRYGIDRASVIRRLVTVLRTAEKSGAPRLGNMVHTTPDPVGDRRNANLTGATR